MKQSKKIALSGMFAALQTVLLCLGGVMWVLCYTAPMICGLIMIILRDSAGTKYALTVYAVCSIIAVLFIPDKECALTYIFFFGYYAIIRDKFEKMPKAVSLLLKFLLYNITIAASQIILVYVFAIPFENELGRWTIPVFAVLFNIVFALYELLFPRVVTLYFSKYKSRVDKLLK
ncbi:MAG: hypothetical protein E7571_04080 [Ruminococcaceae bacterium]|nr:hypothetical protein [Oscillospiraceae bacterium]